VQEIEAEPPPSLQSVVSGEWTVCYREDVGSWALEGGGGGGGGGRGGSEVAVALEEEEEEEEENEEEGYSYSMIL
jgi:hypothetical protein